MLLVVKREDRECRAGKTCPQVGRIYQLREIISMILICYDSHPKSSYGNVLWYGETGKRKAIATCSCMHASTTHFAKRVDSCQLVESTSESLKPVESPQMNGGHYSGDNMRPRIPQLHIEHRGANRRVHPKCTCQVWLALVGHGLSFTPSSPPSHHGTQKPISFKVSSTSKRWGRHEASARRG